MFRGITQKDEVCFAAMVVGLAQNSRPEDALSVFDEMRASDVGSTMYSLSGALRAASELAALEQCRVIHAHAVITGFDLNLIVATAMVDGYGKAGVILDARQIFDELLPRLNEVAWNAMMMGYAQQGDPSSVVELFNSMEARGLVPDDYSFLAILTSLYNAGLVGEAKRWLTRMEVDYGMEPGLEHYTCLVGAMGRAGKLEEAERIAMTMPVKPDAAVWRVLLSSCAMHCAADMAWAMGKRLMELDPHDDSAYVIVANVLAANGRWSDVAEVRKMMKDRMVKKQGGRSWIEVRGKVHVFLSGDRSHERCHEIYAKLEELMEKIGELGYRPVLSEMLHEVEEGVKRETLAYHSEKLAVAFGLVSGAALPGKALRIVKNLRICKDCHDAFKYMSCVVEREIIVRDVNRYHRFWNGTCTCGDYW